MALMEKFSTFFGFQLSLLAFTPVEQVSATIQGKDISAEDSSQASKSLIFHLKRLRTDAEFERFFDRILEESKDKTKAPVLPRNRRVPARFEIGESSTHHFHTDIREFYKQQYFEVIDLLKEETDRRFKQRNFSIIRDLENFLIKSANGENVNIGQIANELYKDDIDMDRLKMQAEMLPAIFEDSGIKKITKISTICDVLNEHSVSKKLLCEIHKLLCIYLTIPVTTATSERTFSTLRRLKTYLRATFEPLSSFAYLQRED